MEENTTALKERLEQLESQSILTQANKIEIDEVMATREQVEREQKDLKIRRDMLEAEFSKKKRRTSKESGNV